MYQTDIELLLLKLYQYVLFCYGNLKSSELSQKLLRPDLAPSVKVNSEHLPMPRPRTSSCPGEQIVLSLGCSMISCPVQPKVLWCCLCPCSSFTPAQGEKSLLPGMQGSCLYWPPKFMGKIRFSFN